MSQDPTYAVLRFEWKDERNAALDKFLSDCGVVDVDGFELLKMYEQESELLKDYHPIQFDVGVVARLAMEKGYFEESEFRKKVPDQIVRMRGMDRDLQLAYEDSSSIAKKLPLAPVPLPSVKESLMWFHLGVGDQRYLVVPFRSLESLGLEEEETSAELVRIKVNFETTSCELELSEHPSLEQVWDEFLAKIGMESTEEDLPDYSFPGGNFEKFDPVAVVKTEVTFQLAKPSKEEEIPAAGAARLYQDVDNESKHALYFRDQEIVAEMLLKKIDAVVKLTKFEAIEFCVATAGYASLREQTPSRMEDFGLEALGVDQQQADGTATSARVSQEGAGERQDAFCDDL